MTTMCIVDIDFEHVEIILWDHFARCHSGIMLSIKVLRDKLTGQILFQTLAKDVPSEHL